MSSLSFTDRIRHWFADDAPAAPRSERAGTAPRAMGSPRPSAAPVPGDETSRNALHKRLMALLAQPQLLATGRVQMINLERVRQHLGAAWPAQRERVHSAADRIIDRHLGPRDVQFRAGEGEYIVVFATLDREAAQLVCAKVAEELHRLFLGEPDLAEVQVATAVAMVDGGMLYQHASVAELLARAGRGAPGGECGPDDAARPDAAPDATPKGATDADADASPEARRLRLAARQEVCIETMFRPVWDVERQVITTYMATPVRHFPDGTSVEGIAALHGIDDPERLSRINCDALIDTAETLDELFRNKFRLMASIPVCFETLSVRRTRVEYLDLCRSVPDHLRPFITFEFLRFPVGVPNGRLTELVNELRPFCRWIFLRAELRQTSFSGLVGTGLTGVSTMAPSERAAEARTMEELDAFVAAAERAHLRSCVIGITSTSLALAARGAGFTFIAGDRIGRVEEIPQHMLRFGWQDLFLREAAHR